MTSQWRTTQQACFGVGDSRDMVESSKATMRRSDAPWVVGRSGPRPEVGRGTSGCLGEVYKTVENPQAMQKLIRNSSIIRSRSFFYRLRARSLSYHFFPLQTFQVLLPRFIQVILPSILPSL